MIVQIQARLRVPACLAAVAAASLLFPHGAGAQQRIQTKDDAVFKCGPIELRGLPITPSTIKCEADKDAGFAERGAATRSTISGAWPGGWVQITVARLVGFVVWQPLSSSELKAAVESWAKGSSPTNLSSFNSAPFPHYTVNLRLNDKPYACARGQMGSGQEKVSTWIAYCEPGSHIITTENLSIVAGAIRTGS